MYAFISCAMFQLKVAFFRKCNEFFKSPKKNIPKSYPELEIWKLVSVVIWFAPRPPDRESRVRIRSPHRNLTKFILVWVFFKKRYSSISGLLSFKKPETVLWTIAKNYYYYYYYICTSYQIIYFTHSKLFNPPFC